MSVQLGSTAPDFSVDTTEGPIKFHEWIGSSWARALLAPEGLHAGVHHRARLRRQDQAGVRQARRQGDRAHRSIRVDSHKKWIGDIEETQSIKMNFPIIGDADSQGRRTSTA